MGIVRFALRFPHTFYVLAMLISFLGITAVVSMPTDIFPEIDIPVVTVIWTYNGLSTPEMEQRVTTYGEFSISSSVNGIKDIESQTLNGISVQKIFFQPDVNLDLAIAQIVAGTNSMRGIMPPGIQAADRRPVQRVERAGAADRPELRHAQRAAALRLRHLSPAPAPRADPRRDPADAVGRTLPPDHGRSRSGEAAGARGSPRSTSSARSTRRTSPCLPAPPRSATPQYAVRTNATPLVDRRAQPHSGQVRRRRHRVPARRRPCARRQPVQQNIVRAEGRRSVLLTHPQERQRLDARRRQPGQNGAARIARGGADGACKITELFDQSMFVANAINGRAARGRHRRRADRPDDPPLPRLVALDADRRASRFRCRSCRRSSCSTSWATPSTR